MGIFYFYYHMADAPADASMQEPQAANEIAKIVMWYFTSMDGVQDYTRTTDRIPVPGRSSSMMKQISKYNSISDGDDPWGPYWSATLFHQFIILSACSFYNMDKISLTFKCYDNIFADMALK